MTVAMANQCTWDYSLLHGPAKWSEYYEIGHKQSPININRKDVHFDDGLASNPLRIDHRQVFLHVTNVGFNISAAFSTKSQYALKLSGGPLTHEYQFREMHLHWGVCDDRGSEHKIDGQCYSAELHLVHWNPDLYKTESEAICSPLGLAVLGVFLDSFEDEHNESLEKLLKMFEKVEFKDEDYLSDAEINPYSVLPSNVHDFFTYDGSLTTPPCYESVKWIVFANPVKVSRMQLQRLRKLKAVTRHDGGGGKFHNPFSTSLASRVCAEAPCIGDNYRPVMDVNGREILSSFSVFQRTEN